MKTLHDHLLERGFIENTTVEHFNKILEKPLKVYLGFDPTADSLHLGSWMGIVLLKWFQKFGHEIHPLIGGATGQIGDPSGKSIERPFLDDKELKHNVHVIETYLKKMLTPEKGKLTTLNNQDWMSKMSAIEYLRDVGKYFRVNNMLTKESVKLRINSEEGISYTEFSYQILQGYDFYYLFKHHGITLQLGGADQWGNITAGIEYARRVDGTTLYGMTFPLLTRSDGKKFGKSEGGAIWLNPEKLSPYLFYQYVLKMPDADVIKMMKMLTFMDIEEINHWAFKMVEKDYEANSAQKKLADEVTKLVHGEEGLSLAQKATEGAFSKEGLSGDVLKEIAHDLPHIQLKKEEVIGQKFVDIAVKSNLVESKSEAHRLIKNGGAYINNEKISDTNLVFADEHLIENQFILLGMGKKKKILIKIQK